MALHCKKYPHIHGYSVASFPYFNGTVSALNYSVDLRIQTYTETVPLKYGKLATKYPWICGNFYSEYEIEPVLAGGENDLCVSVGAVKNATESEYRRRCGRVRLHRARHGRSQLCLGISRSRGHLDPSARPHLGLVDRTIIRT